MFLVRKFFFHCAFGGSIELLVLPVYTSNLPCFLSVSNLGSSISIDNSEDAPGALGALCAPYARVL